MDIDYPDIISEYLVATKRYEIDGVQVIPYLEPSEVAVGEAANLALLLQSALDVAVELSVKPELPQTSRFRGTPMLAVGKPELSVTLEPAQVGILFVPVATTPQTKEGQHEIRLSVLAKAQERATPERSVYRSRSGDRSRLQLKRRTWQPGSNPSGLRKMPGARATR
jgi:hypothetical protein